MSRLTGVDWILTQNDPVEAEEYANILYLEGYCIEHDEEFDEEGCRGCTIEDIQNEWLDGFNRDVL
jgi:hypothetical protein